MSQRTSWAAGCFLGCILVFQSLGHGFLIDWYTSVCIPVAYTSPPFRNLPLTHPYDQFLPAEATVRVAYSPCPLRSWPACCLCISSLHLQSICMCKQLVPSWFLWSRFSVTQSVRSAERSRITQGETPASYGRL